MEIEERKSKSQVKREMLELQELGKQLIKLTPDQLNKIAMDEELREAVIFARSIRSNEAFRRQLQFLGTLMRQTDPEPIRQALQNISGGSRAEARSFQKLERLRDTMVAGDEAAIDDFVEQHPQADRRRLRQLAMNAAREKAKSKPPKSSRALFRYLREITHADTGNNQTNEQEHDRENDFEESV